MDFFFYLTWYILCMHCVVCYIDVGDCIPVAVFGHALPRLSSEYVTCYLYCDGLLTHY